MKQLTVMVMVPDRARADMLFSADRIYYRFTTTDTDDEGSAPSIKGDFDDWVEHAIDALSPKEGEAPVNPEDIRVSVFVDNVVRKVSPTEQSLRRFISHVCSVDDAFSFLSGFA